jgi:anthranilate synthase component 1
MKVIPSEKDFHEYAEKGNLIPVFTELSADMDTPVSAYAKITAETDDKALSFMLESVEGGENIGRYSILGTAPRAVFVQTENGARFIQNGNEEPVSGHDAFERIHRVMKKFRPVKIENLPPFAGGAVGYAAYDIVSEIENTVKQPENKPLDLPDAFFMITDGLLVFDRVRHTIKIISQAYIPEKDKNSVNKAYSEAVGKIKELAAKLKKPLASKPVEFDSAYENTKPESNKSLAEFRDMVERTKKYIYDGDIIQAVLSQRFSADIPYSPFAVYRALRMVNPSPYMFLLNCGDFSIVGASPEVMAKCEGKKITVRPIAGTRKRGGDEQADKALENELLADPKERAEHIMLVDLGRNDIGRIAREGSVRVDNLMTVERYSHVMHIVSNVTGILDTSKYEPDSVMRSTFPAGTLSGAPKVRAMQIISELENERRGPYGGTVAYYSFDGNINSCITIRTAVLKDGKAYFQSGAGIVADSDPEKEYEETENKARAMLKAISMAEFFEMTSA